jgi:hypothetical protein
MIGTQRGCRDIELFSSLSDNEGMGRPKGFNREANPQNVAQLKVNERYSPLAIHAHV